MDERERGYRIGWVGYSSTPVELAREGTVLTNPRQLTYVADITATFPEDDVLFIYCVSRLLRGGQFFQARGWVLRGMLREDRRSSDAKMLPLTKRQSSTDAAPGRLRLSFRRRLNRK
jgi:hypothetical protein